MRTAKRLRAIAFGAAVASMSVVVPARAADKRTLPDYDGRGGEPTGAGDTVLWVPRILLSPAYFVSEYLLRRPLGWLIAGAERAGLPALLYDTFTFGPEHKVGVVPTFFADFGFRPSVGLYGFWDDAFTEGNDLRLHAATWGSDWLSGSLSDRIHNGKDPLDRIRFDVSGTHRLDHAFFGIGPSSRAADITRYGSDLYEGSASLQERLWRASSFHARILVRSVDFHRGRIGDDVALDDAIARGLVPAPPGYPRGYTAIISSIGGALDSRVRRPATGSGVRIELDGAHASDVRQSGGWITYGGTAGAFLDPNDHARVLSASFTAKFADPLADAAIPFTDLVQLGGFGQMRAFFPGRLLGRSAAVAGVGYRWPIWVWLDGSIRAEVGNVFGEHLQGFRTGLLRFSGEIGVESVGSPDNSLQILLGWGSETFESGGKIDSFRFVVGTTHGF